MNIKRQFPSLPRQIDISKQPYDRYLENLKYWKIKDYETVIKTLQYFIKYKYQCLAEMEYISQRVTAFHKDICKVNDKGSENQEKVEIDTEYFEKVIELKTRFKKLAKQGCFQGEKKIRNRFEQIQKQKKNLVNVSLVIPNDILISQQQLYHKNQISSLYRSFVAYFPEAHNEPVLNIKVACFVKELYKEMKKKFFYMRQREYFNFEVQKLCQKLRNQKFLENKKLMITGEISIKEIVMNRISVFQNYSVKRKEHEDMMKILRESEIQKQNELTQFRQLEETEDNKENQEEQFIEEKKTSCLEDKIFYQNQNPQNQQELGHDSA